MNGRLSRRGTSSPEMHKTQVRAALQHLVGGNGGIKTAGEQANKATGGVRREPARTDNAAGIDQKRPTRDFDAAGERGCLQVDADVAAVGLQLVKKVAANLAFDGHGVEGKALVAAARAYGKSGELFATDLLPDGVTNRVERIVLQSWMPQHARNSEMRNAADAG